MFVGLHLISTNWKNSVQRRTGKL